MSKSQHVEPACKPSLGRRSQADPWEFLGQPTQPIQWDPGP